MDFKPPTASRRDLLKAAAAIPLASVPIASRTMQTPNSFLNLLRPPDLVRTFGPMGEVSLTRSGDKWIGAGVEIEIKVQKDHALLTMKSTSNVSRIQCRWRGDLRAVKRLLGDHWERSYADLEWRGDVPGRSMPWYFMANDGQSTHGYGVRTGPRAMCFWNADPEGISLWADVRSGGVPVELGTRTLEVAEIVCRESVTGENAFKATQSFCRQMCSSPRLPKTPVFGTNDWNFAYGNNSADLIERVSSLIGELSPDAANRPFSVIDEGWALGPFHGNFGHGPWEGNPRFGDMAAFALRLKSYGVRPGLWFRPLTPLPDSPSSWSSKRDAKYLDPTVPEVQQHVATHISRFVGWGYQMIKHDFTSYDLLGLWGFEMGASPTADGWRLHDASKTNAEVLTDLYRTIRTAAGDALLIGCNTMSHLAAGFHEVQRTGDDTSGRSWNRNRRMGVNTLAFRAPQHRAFYELDPDIVAITKQVPWNLVEQWLRLVSESGAALFVAADPAIVEPKHRAALKRAFEIAFRPQVVGEPLDWMDTDCPRRWKLMGQETEFAWMGDYGAWPFGD